MPGAGPNQPSDSASANAAATSGGRNRCDRGSVAVRPYRLDSNRQHQAHDRAAAPTGFELDLSAVSFNNALHDGQAQARSLPLGGLQHRRERLPALGLVMPSPVSANSITTCWIVAPARAAGSAPGVLLSASDSQPTALPGRVARAGDDGQRPALRHGFDGVEGKIQERLLQLRGVAGHGRQRRVELRTSSTFCCFSLCRTSRLKSSSS